MKTSVRLQRARQRVNAVAAALRAIPRGRYAGILCTLLALVVLRSGIGALRPFDWFMENMLVVLVGIPLVLTYRKMPLSRVSVTRLEPSRSLQAIWSRSASALA